MKSLIKSLTKFELGLIVSIIVLNIVVGLFSGGNDIIGLTACITGVICVVLTAKGHIGCYYFGIVNILAYVVIAFASQFYGEFMLNGLYYLPMQFVGIWVWKKNLNKETQIVKGKTMTLKQIMLLSLVSIVLTVAYSFFLKELDGRLPLIDSMSTVLSVIAMVISVKMFAEQWLLWIVVDIITVIMWVIALISKEPNSLIMVIMWTAYLLNAVYGYLNWRKLAKAS